MSEGKPEFLKESCRIWSWLAPVLVMLDEIELSVIWLNKSLVAFFSAALPDFLSFYEEFLPLLQAIAATKSYAPDESHLSFQQAVDYMQRNVDKARQQFEQRLPVLKNFDDYLQKPWTSTGRNGSCTNCFRNNRFDVRKQCWR